MANTRVKDLMAMLETETDPDQIAILKFDLDEALGRKDAGVTPKGGSTKGVSKKMGGGYMMDDQNKKVRKARHGGSSSGNYGGDEVMAAGSCKGAGAAIRGTKFSGLF